MRLWDAHGTTPRRFYHSFLVGKRSPTGVNTSIYKSRLISGDSDYTSECPRGRDLLPAALKLLLAYLDRVSTN
jgi:hypothetical protein